VTRVALVLVAACAACTTTAAADAGAPGASVRVAQLSADLPGKTDVCLLRAGEALLGGPVARGVGAAWIQRGQVTRAVDVAPGPAAVRVVAAGTSSCGNGLQPDLPVVIPAGRSTVVVAGVIAGDAAHPLVALVVPDDPPALALGVRAVNVDAAAPTVDVGVVCAGAFAGEAAAYGAVGAYRDAPFADCTPTARLPGQATDYAHTSARATAAAGTFHTAYVFGGRIILCDDAPTAEPLASCVE
jgi:hypothetical protein